MTTHKYRKNIKKTNTRKNRGGKLYGTSGNVKLTFHNKKVDCEICGSNDYTEKTGAFGKSKIRSGLGQMMFGDAADVLDTTSVIIYICNNCGLCKVIRNREPLLIKTEKI
jgi:ssDNA-binding Zn-finger/Zn-ribbon topoisomerase 1